MNIYKAGIFFVLCAVSTQSYAHVLATLFDYARLSALIGITSFEVTRLEESIKQVDFQEAHVHEHPYNKYNLEIARGNVTTMVYSSGALSLLSVYVLLHRPSTFAYNCMRLVTVLNIIVGMLLANDYWKFDKKYQDYVKQS